MLRPVLPVVLGLIAACPAQAENWPQWRGPKNDGHSREKNLPVEWSETKNIVWKVKLPADGSSTPAIWEDKIFLTCPDGPDIVLLCLSTKNGQELWRDTLSNTGTNRRTAEKTTDASASPTTDGKHVWSYVGGHTAGRITCHTVDGKLVWDKNVQDYGRLDIAFGSHWTPVVYKGVLYQQVMHRKAQLLVALDALTGREIWKVNRPGYGKGESPDVYASAFVWEGEGGPLLVAHGNDYCTGHKLENGEEVWRVHGLNPKNNGAWRFISNPLLTPDLIVVPSCKDGPTVAFNPVGAKGDITPDNKAELWRLPTSANFRTPDVVTPVRVDDIVYITGDGPFWAIDAKTGQIIYRQMLSGGRHRGNMVVADGLIYVTSSTGAVDVVKAGRQFQKVATNKLPDTFYAGPAISNGRIYLRGYEYLWAIGTK